mmetsp:Transcript_13789/g.24639  ORF Transcript_13789/g.24639 Transcript_13789/m.24639 type:complete len:235 (+) Transcript_13789:50-754(+)|eukprot:CAMPEP_0184511510 /NCGR_PEP_ID=MMETSP0198_2-20121128/2389_1 /TAXON_ID=1112570 /ORGANISM="Thraustochytrium sp., Strain LLF1b" /LENGTH=234 /DNA_ID=CAMNT_0026901479 /DNA_START=76 /DNA_END=780 /DNA_ORIENTATION=-
MSQGASHGGGGHGHSHNGGGHGHGAGSGGHGHSHGAGGSCKPEDPDGQSLLPFIDTGLVTCLNEREDGMGRSVLKPLTEKFDETRFLISEEDDAELILYIPFTVAVKVKSFCIIGGAHGQSPSKVKLFVNRDDVDFALAEDLAPTQELELSEDFEGLIDYPVRAAKFSNITSLTMFFPANFGADSTQITYLGLKGEGTTARRGVVECTYEARAQMKDHAQTRADTLNTNQNGLS